MMRNLQNNILIFIHPNSSYGMCLTTPFHLQSFDENSIQVHTAKLEAISKKGANNMTHS